MEKARARFWIALAMVCLAGSLGCSNDGHQVTGRVTLDSHPVADAMVQFVPQSESARPAVGKTDSNGSYRLVTSRSVASVFPGKYLVQITTSDVFVDENGNETCSAEKIPKSANELSQLFRVVDNDQARSVFDFELNSD